MPPLALADDGKKDNDNIVPLALTDDGNKDNDNDGPFVPLLVIAGRVAIFDETSYALQKSISKKRSLFWALAIFLRGTNCPVWKKTLLSDTQGMTCNDRTWVW